MTPAQQAFLAELTELTRKHGVKVASCGCCGGVWLDELKAKEKATPHEYDAADDGSSVTWEPTSS